MRYHYRIRESRWNPERPSFMIERTYDNRLLVLLGWADWYLLGFGPFSTIEVAKEEIRKSIEADKAYAIRAKETATRIHYL
jgi:hypothetical protein